MGKSRRNNGPREPGERTETRIYTNPGQWLSPQTQSGITVTPDTALTYSAVFAAINVISTDIASLPCVVYQADVKGGKVHATDHPLYDLLMVEPNDEMDCFHFTQTLISHALRFGNAYAEILWSDTGYPEALLILDPRYIQPKRNNQGKLIYQVLQGTFANGEAWLSPDNVIHLKGLSHDGIVGYSPISQARQTIGLGLAQEVYGSSFYGNNAVPSGFLKTTQTLKKEARENKVHEYEDKHGGAHNAFRTGVLTGDWEWISTSINPVDAEYLASREFSIVEIARWFNISPVKLQDLTQAHYNNVEQLETDYSTNTLRPWIVNYESELRRKLLTRAERKTYSIRHDLSERMRGDESSRVTYYNSLFSIGVISRDEIRLREDLNRVPGGDRYFLAANNYSALGDDGLPVVPIVPVASTEPQPVIEAPQDAPQAVSPDPDAVAAVRAVLVDGVSRLVRREVTALRRSLKKPDHGKAVRDFYSGHQPVVVESLAPLVTAFNCVTRRTLELDGLVSKLVENSEVTEEVLSNWESSKAENLIREWEELG